MKLGTTNCHYLQHLFSDCRLFQCRNDIHNSSHIDDLDKNICMINTFNIHLFQLQAYKN